MSATEPPNRHDQDREWALDRTLAWAEEAARNGDYFSAVRWLDTLDAIDGGIPVGYRDRRRRWMRLAQVS